MGTAPVIVAGGSADATSQAAAPVNEQFLNRMPTITIREGHRVKVYVTRDVELPEWNDSATTASDTEGAMVSAHPIRDARHPVAAPPGRRWRSSIPRTFRKTVLIAQRTQRHLEELQAQYRTISECPRAWGTSNDTGPRDWACSATARSDGRKARAWLTGLNSGDPAGTGYAFGDGPLNPSSHSLAP